MGEKGTAAYQIVSGDGGNCYRFYCGISGALVCTTQPYTADTIEEELKLAWENEGKRHFNLCHKCGRYVMDAEFNPEVSECTDCAPFEHETRFCKSCGAKINADTYMRFCPVCKKKLHYEGGGSG